jgi:hypothetical protein
MSQRGVNSGSQIPLQRAWTLCMNITPTSIEYQLADARLLAVTATSIYRLMPPPRRPCLSQLSNAGGAYRQYPERTINLALGVHGQVDPVTGVSQTMPQARWKSRLK